MQKGYGWKLLDHAFLLTTVTVSAAHRTKYVVVLHKYMTRDYVVPRRIRTRVVREDIYSHVATQTLHTRGDEAWLYSLRPTYANRIWRLLRKKFNMRERSRTSDSDLLASS